MEIIARRWGVSVGRELLEALSTALKEALGDEKRREIMREANLAVVKERADWDKNFATLLKAYKRLSGEEHQVRFLVAGCGSIGKRHLSNLRLLSAGEAIAKLADAKINQWERGPEWS